MMADDEALMSELRQALRSREAVTQRSREAARAAFTWRTIDEELLELSHDSLAGAQALVRGPAEVVEARVVSFEGQGISVELELEAGHLIGQVLPGQSGSVTVQSPSSAQVTVEVDDAGLFEILELPPAPLRLRLELGGRVLTTAWLTGPP